MGSKRLSERGQGLTEYALVLAGMSVVLVVVAALGTPALYRMYNAILNVF